MIFKPDRKFRVVIADPPYHHKNSLAYRHALHPSAAYETMTNDDIEKIPVVEWCRDDCVLCLWCPPTFVAVACRIMKAWGFDQITSVPWTKTYPIKWEDRQAEDRAKRLIQDCSHSDEGICAACLAGAIEGWPYPVGNVKRGAGVWFMQTWEQVLIGERGVPGVKKYTEPGLLAYMIGEPKGMFSVPSKRHHSAKPYILHDFIEQFPGPYLELFATEKRENWSTWGYDTGFRLSERGVERGGIPPDPQGGLFE